MLTRRMLLALGMAGVLPACPRRGAERATLFAAASLEGALSEIARARAPRPVLHFASSGSLVRQLLATSAADLFFSAGVDQVETLERAGKVVAGSRRDLLSNQLVVVARRSSPIRAERLEDLRSARFRHLVIGDPESVPAGAYAKQALAPIWDELGARLLPVPDVRAALAQAERRDDALAIVFATDARSSDRVRVSFIIDGPTAPRIIYPLVELVGGPNPAGGHALSAVLASGEARSVYERHGFRVLP